jgi:3-deoxy-7-phosphoheptulonate synthase
VVQHIPWHPGSWRNYSALQQPTYPDQQVLIEVQNELLRLPPLVASSEILALKQQIAQAQEGKSFLLQGGDCAENFSDCESSLISNRLKVLLQMSLVLVHGLRKPVLRVGRFAGQYAKPRSTEMEARGGISLPSYRGDFINAPEFTEAARLPDPRRMVKGHARSAMTMNFVRSLIDGGFADLHHPEYWDLAWVSQSPQSEQYRKLVRSVEDSIRFMETISGEPAHNVNRTEFYTSHEALLLPYEASLTRQVPRQNGWFNLSTHYPWMGVRTAQLDGAHMEYFSGIANPIGVKISANASDDYIKQLCETLNPDNEPGRLTLIHRLGAQQVQAHLPRLIRAVRTTGARVLWVCDPMHGNTESTSNGYKTRHFNNIKTELERSFDVHAVEGSYLGGVHLELTGENVTECLGGARDLSEHDLERAYQSSVDPRMNYEQSLEIAMSIVHKHRSSHK